MSPHPLQPMEAPPSPLPQRLGNASGCSSSSGEVVEGGETKFIGRVAEPPSTGFSPPQHRTLTLCTAGDSSTRDR